MAKTAKKRPSETKSSREYRSSASPARTTLPRSVMWHEPDVAEFRRRVEQKAYELFERRGGEPGHDVEDWLEAERLVREETRQPQEMSAADR